MAATAKVSSKGQVTIPKELRDDLEIDKGDQLVFLQDNGNLILRKVTLDDIREKAMEDYRKGNTLSHEEVFEDLL